MTAKEMNIDIVKPIPPSIPTPAICFQCDFSGKLLQFNFTVNHDNSAMPIGFPRISPRMMPVPNPLVKFSTEAS